MALKPKHPHICIDEKIWDDPVMIGISGDAFRVYIFAIAWSKGQNGRTPDGLLTTHGIGRVGATLELLQELVNSRLLEKCEEGYKILKYEEWQMTAAEARGAAERAAVKSELGKHAASARWSKEPPPPVEEGFNQDEAFSLAWADWPEPSEARFTEKRDEALESFRSNITNSKDWGLFQAALMKRVKDYHGENKPKSERRKFLGAFKNFCDSRWKDWIPKSMRLDGQQVVAPVPVQETHEVPYAPGVKAPDDRPTYKSYDQQMEENFTKFLAEEAAAAAKGP